MPVSKPQRSEGTFACTRWSITDDISTPDPTAREWCRSSPRATQWCRSTSRPTYGSDPRAGDTLRTAAQIASAQGASAEAASTVTSVGEHETSIDFAARWPDLPKSLDLDGRSLATMSNAYAEEQADGSEQLPSVPSESEGMAAFMSAAPRLRWCLCCCLPARFSCSPAGVNRIIAIIGVRLHTGDAHASSCDLISPRWPVGRRRERGTTVRFGNRRRRPIRPVTSRRICGNSWATCNGPGRRVARFGHSHRLRIVAPLIPDAS
jgi:hypothetical protein